MCGDGGTAAGTQVVAGSNSGLSKRAIAKSARVPVPAVQNFRPRPSWQAAAHFGVYFCRSIWDRLRRIAGRWANAPSRKRELDNGVWGVFRSDNAGGSWRRINDDRHQFGGIRPIAADQNIAGRLYIGGGRGACSIAEGKTDALADEMRQVGLLRVPKSEKVINETKKMQYGGDLVGRLGSMWLWWEQSDCQPPFRACQDDV